MKKLELAMHSDDCTYVVVDGENLHKSDYTDKVVSIGPDIKARFVFDWGNWKLVFDVPEDMEISVEEIDEDDDY